MSIESSPEYEKTFVFCLLGDNHISNNFLKGWTEIVGFCLMNKIKPILSCGSVDNYVSRMGSLMVSGESNIPFDGKVKYDKIIFISSKVICSIESLRKLISSDKDIVSALCSNKFGLENTNYIENFDLNVKGTSTFEYASLEDARNRAKIAKDANETTLMKVNYVNFNILSVNRGVLERLGMPWFNYDPMTNDITGDSYFCNKCKQAGIDIFVDLDCFVTTEKNIVY